MATEEDSLTALCQKLGSTPEQARIMAKQLLKRADQLATERGISRVEAMGHLLQLLTRGSQGDTVPGFEGVKKANPPA